MRQYRTRHILSKKVRGGFNCEGLRREHLREQQGLSSGHWLLELHVVVAKAVADRARRAVTKRTIVSDYVRKWGGNQINNGMYKKKGKSM